MTDEPKITINAPKEELTSEDELHLIEWVERRKSINLVKACEQLGFSYYHVMERIREQGFLHKELHTQFQKLKSHMLGRVQEAIAKGDARGLAPVSHIKLMIEVIDSGTLLGGTMGARVTKEAELNDDSDEFSL